MRASATIGAPAGATRVLSAAGPTFLHAAIPIEHSTKCQIRISAYPPDSSARRTRALYCRLNSSNTSSAKSSAEICAISSASFHASASDAREIALAIAGLVELRDRVLHFRVAGDTEIEGGEHLTGRA